jgi:uncharacterized membrane protein
MPASHEAARDRAEQFIRRKLAVVGLNPPTRNLLQQALRAIEAERRNPRG